MKVCVKGQRCSEGNGRWDIARCTFSVQIPSHFRKTDAFCYGYLALEHCNMFILGFTCSDPKYSVGSYYCIGKPMTFNTKAEMYDLCMYALTKC